LIILGEKGLSFAFLEILWGIFGKIYQNQQTKCRLNDLFAS